MILNMDIPNFGSFKNFVWRTAMRDKGNNVAQFKRLNIFYGRNYSGKTTISRIFRSLQTGRLPAKYESPAFSIETTSGKVTQTGIPIHDQEIRVYNRDFVAEHLSFLTDDNGEILPFAIVGAENQAIETSIQAKEDELGDDKSGLRSHLAVKQQEFDEKNRAAQKAESNLKRKLTNKATQAPNGIKHNPLYKDPNYNTPKLQRDIDEVRAKSIQELDEPLRKSKEAMLSEVALPGIKLRLRFTSQFDSLYKSTQTLVSKSIEPTRPIRDLLNNSLLQTWVKQGIHLHKDVRTTCAFCSQPLPQDIWHRLSEHFNQQSAELESALERQAGQVERERESIAGLFSVTESAFYSTLQPRFCDAKESLDRELHRYTNLLDQLLAAIRTRQSNVFSAITLPDLSDNSLVIAQHLATINALIDQNNQQTESLSDDQATARRELRLSEIAKFIAEIDLSADEKALKGLAAEVQQLNGDIQLIRQQIASKEQEIAELTTQLTDERKGAEKINEYLNHYFGHGGLHLEAMEDTETSAFKFQILRGSTPAYNLSEGECSLVAFCYFIAKLQDAESQNKKLVIFIDDPVSSLDSNHIFFVFSLIQSLIAKPEEDADGNRITDASGRPVYRYEQLFISTHSLEFLKYLNKLSQPKNDHEHFLVISSDQGSTLQLMPAYLRMYITELNYLFGEIYTCADPMNAAEQHHCFYNFGNNLRKFLEAFLFFKFPFAISDKADYDRRIRLFFRSDVSTDALVNRITHEFSHLGSALERCVQPVDHAEIAKLARFVLQKIKENDEEQFRCFLKSIESPDPFQI